MLLKNIHPSRTNKYVIPVRLHKSARLNNFKPNGLICYYFFPSVFLSFSLFHSRLNFMTVSTLQKKVPANKNYRTNFSGKNLLQRKYCMLYQEIVSVQSQLVSFFSEKYWRILSIVWKYVFLLHVLNKTTILSVLGTGLFLKSQKLIPSKKNQSVLIAKISSHKKQKTANPQK